MTKTFRIREIPAEWTFYTNSLFFQKAYKCKYSINGVAGHKTFADKDDFENEMYKVECLASFINGFYGGDLSFIQGEPQRCLLHNAVSYFAVYGIYPHYSLSFSHDWPLFQFAMDFDGVKCVVRLTRFLPSENYYELILKNTVTDKIETKRIMMTTPEVNAHLRIIKQSIIKTFQKEKRYSFSFNLDKDALGL